ncbi:ABC transporter permease [Lactobacillus sp. CC-MHH1034]|uniref:ABC transporter permease n=1 Tax=Agrilactobacillus fermenti TaxID=2586909 RepID=UPI001E659C0A|nr:ABC transporter permease [Agrilactobacillus fermenti]MCD2256327.1 ABC transporter permease [Agrilactobacillus fermenti]
MTEKHTWIGKLYLAFAFAILYMPIFYLVFYSFNSGKNMSGFKGFTWSHYQTLFADSRLIIIVLQTFLVAILSALIATIVGSLGALGIYQVRRRHTRNLLLSLNNILMVSPDVIIGASFLILFTAMGIALGFGSVLASHIAFSIPIVVLLVLPRLQEMDYAMIDAARDLGANSWQILSRVILPFILPSVFSGYFMAFTYSLDDFAVTFFVTGNGFATLSVEIYSRARQGINLEINALSALMFLFSIILIVGYYLLNQYTQSRRQRRQKDGVYLK